MGAKVGAEAVRDGAAVTDTSVHTGRCHCGAVTYRADGLRDIWYCHCRQCRSLTGHYLAACRTEADRIDVSGEVKWTSVSETSAHGFCPTCSSPMFWRKSGSPTFSVLPGSLDSCEGIEAKGHIFVSEKGSYYVIDDGLPQYSTWPETDAGVTGLTGPA